MKNVAEWLVSVLRNFFYTYIKLSRVRLKYQFGRIAQRSYVMPMSSLFTEPKILEYYYTEQIVLNRKVINIFLAY